jgi:hypothetical protein
MGIAGVAGVAGIAFGFCFAFIDFTGFRFLAIDPLFPVCFPCAFPDTPARPFFPQFQPLLRAMARVLPPKIRIMANTIANFFPLFINASPLFPGNNLFFLCPRQPFYFGLPDQSLGMCQAICGDIYSGRPAAAPSDIIERFGSPDHRHG